jgi:hypothetical protein
MSDTAVGYLGLVGGTVLLGLAALAWLGIWRRWAGQILFGLHGLPFPLTLLPALGLMLVGGGLTSFEVVAVSSPVNVVLYLAALALIVLWFWGPSWFGPRWYRDEMESGGKPDVHDGLTAMAVGWFERDRIRHPEPFAGREPTTSWTAVWIFGDEDGPRPHALGRAGAVDGKLSLYPEGIAFVARKSETALRGPEPLWFEVPWSEFRGARSVPARCDPDGHKRPGPLFHRSWWPRLVIDSVTGPYLLEVGAVEKKIEAIESRPQRSAQGA